MVEASDEAPKWHPDVQFFKILDGASKEHLASFYLDPYARPENKRGGAWMGVCLGKSGVLDRKPVAVAAGPMGNRVVDLELPPFGSAPGPVSPVLRATGVKV